jgi:WD40 repeat protein
MMPSIKLFVYTSYIFLPLILFSCAGDIRQHLRPNSPQKNVNAVDQEEIDCTMMSVSFSHDGRFLASGGGDVCLWDIESGRLLKTYQTQPVGDIPKYIISIAFSPNNADLVTGSYDGVVRVWERSTGSLLQQLKGHKAVIRSVTYSSNGRYIASGSFDGTVRVWNANTGEQMRVFEGDLGSIETVHFSPDDRLIVVGGVDGVHLLDTTTGKQIGKYDISEDEIRIRYAGFSPDGHQVYIVGSRGAMYRWDLASAKQVQISGDKIDLQGFPADLSPDGQLIIMGGNGLIGLMDTGKGREIKLFHTGDQVIKDFDFGSGDQVIRGLAFGPDGKHFASVGYDGVLRLWDLQQSEPVQTFELKQIE